METNKSVQEIISLIEQDIARYHELQIKFDENFNAGKDKSFSWRMSQENYYKKMALCFLLVEITGKPIEQIIAKYCKEQE